MKRLMIYSHKVEYSLFGAFIDIKFASRIYRPGGFKFVLYLRNIISKVCFYILVEDFSGFFGANNLSERCLIFGLHKIFENEKKSISPVHSNVRSNIFCKFRSTQLLSNRA